METVEFDDIEVLGEAAAGLQCRILTKRVTVPSLLLQPGTTVRGPGDRATLVIPRWLGIGLGLVWPFVPDVADTEREGKTREGVREAVDVSTVTDQPRRRPPRRASSPDRRSVGHGA